MPVIDTVTNTDTNELWLVITPSRTARPMCRVLTAKGNRCKNHASAEFSVPGRYGEPEKIPVCGLHALCATNVHHS